MSEAVDTGGSNRSGGVGDRGAPGSSQSTPPGGVRPAPSAPGREFTATCEFARHTIGLLLQWFTAFSAVNMLAIGWVVTAEWKSGVIRWIVGAYMGSQNILGAIAIVCVGRHLDHVAARLPALLDPYEQSPIPSSLYRRATRLMRDALLTSALVWCVIPAFGKDKTSDPSARDGTPAQSPAKERDR